MRIKCRMLRATLILFTGLLLFGSFDAAAHEMARRMQGVSFDQRLNAQAPLTIPLLDENGRRIALGDFLNGKPAILVMNYYQCPNLCPVVLEGLRDSLNRISFVAGREFSVITVSIDPRDKPSIAASKKALWLQRYRDPYTAGGVHFLTESGGASIQPLTDAIGFHYRYDPEGKTYAHPAGIVVLTPEGKVSRYFFGVHFSPPDLRLSLVEAAHRQIGSVSDRLWLFCSHYDPVTGKYTLTIIGWMRIFGALTVIGLVSFILIQLRHDRRESPSL